MLFAFVDSFQWNFLKKIYSIITAKKEHLELFETCNHRERNVFKMNAKVLHILFHGCILVRENQKFKTLKTCFCETNSVTLFVPWMRFSSRKPRI